LNILLIQTSVALDGNPEPDLLHATGCKQPTLKHQLINSSQNSLQDNSTESYKIFKKAYCSSTTIKKTDGKWARSNLEKANIFAQHIEKRFHPNRGSDTLPDLNHNDYLDKIPLVTPKTQRIQIGIYRLYK
jgi:hypothetical protein